MENSVRLHFFRLFENTFRRGSNESLLCKNIYCDELAIMYPFVFIFVL